MARSPNQKLKLLYLRQFLEENTDEEHPASTARLINFLAEQGIGQGTIRLSIGTEHIDDIIADLEKGFAAV